MGEPKNPFTINENSPESIREKMKNPGFLPSRAQILEAFKLEGTNHFDRGEWGEFLDGPYRNHYEILTEDFIRALGDYIGKRIFDLGKQKGNQPIIILETGAGNGRLSHFLKNQLLKKVGLNFKIIASDSGTWKIKPDFPVEEIDVEQALRKYNPDIVVSSWETHSSHDWTKYYEENQNVKEYVLIEIPREHSSSRKFSMTHLEDIEEKQICRHDGDIDKPHFVSESKTMSFKREE